MNELRSMNVTPHIARNTRGRCSALDGRTTRHPGYAVSQRIRKRIEEGFGWGKEFGLLRPNPDARPRARRHGLRLLGRSLQPRPTAEAAQCTGGGVRWRGRTNLPATGCRPFRNEARGRPEVRPSRFPAGRQPKRRGMTLIS